MKHTSISKMSLNRIQILLLTVTLLLVQWSGSLGTSGSLQSYGRPSNFSTGYPHIPGSHVASNSARTPIRSSSSFNHSSSSLPYTTYHPPNNMPTVAHRYVVPPHKRQRPVGPKRSLDNLINRIKDKLHGSTPTTTRKPVIRPPPSSDVLGDYLGYVLGKMPHLTHDYYTFYHYYRNKAQAPLIPSVTSNDVVTCFGNNRSICTANTTALCVKDGVIMCVANMLSTHSCINDKSRNCVKSSVPCINRTPKCIYANQIVLDIPCIYTTIVYGSISYVNNRIIVSNSTLHRNILGNTTNVTMRNISFSSPPFVYNNTYMTDKRGEMFCVTVITQRKEKKVSEGEKVFSQVRNVFANFAVRTLGIS